MEAIIGLLIALAFILIIVGVPIYVSLLLTGVLSLLALCQCCRTPLMRFVRVVRSLWRVYITVLRVI